MDGGGEVEYVFGFIFFITWGSEWSGPEGGLATYTHTLQTRLVALCLSSRATKNELF